MPTVVEQIPDVLKADAEAAVAWLNAERGADFHLTGLIDPEHAVSTRAADADAALDLGLVLCQDEQCRRERVRIEPNGDGFRVSSLEESVASTDPTTDPPAGVRSGWLDEQLSRHAFVVLVFYRGFW
jgi:hypothetical protein